MIIASLSTPRAERPSGALSWVLIGLFGLYLAVSAWVTWRGTVLAPYSDMFDYIGRYYAFTEGMDLSTYLFAPHNFHRMAWTFAVLALDIRVFGANGLFLFATNAACLAAVATMLGREATRAAPVSVRLPVAALAIMLTFVSVNLWAVGIFIHGCYLHVLAFGVAAIVVGEPLAGRPVPLRRRAAALLLAVAAAFGNAVGLALWPVMFACALATRDDWRWMLTLALTGAAFGFAYMSGQTNDAAHAVEAGGPFGAAGYFLDFLGLPWTRAARTVGWAMGAVVLAASLAGLFLKARPGASRSERIAVQLILFSLAAAALAAAGRTVTDPPTPVTIRYATFLTPLHVGLLMLAAPWLGRLRERMPRPTDIAAVAVAALMVAHQIASGVLVVAAADANRRLLAQFRAGARTPAMLQVVHPILSVAERVETRMRRDGYYRHELHLNDGRQ